MRTVGYIDIEKYRCVTDNITTNEVIITDERTQHIKEFHPGDFEIVSPFFRMVLDDPDYILEDEDRENTGLILKVIKSGDLRIQVVLRLHTSTDPKEFKNSIISAWQIRKKEYRRLIRNKKILYKRE